MDLRKQKRIQDHFERMYQVGDKPWVDHGAEIELDEFLKLIGKRLKIAKVLDVGCGDGWISIKFAQKGHKVWGIDSSQTAIAEANFKAKQSKVSKNTHFIVGDALNLPYKNNFFDAIIDRGLFHHILPQNRSLYFENILRVLSDKSFFYLSVFSRRNLPGIGQLFSKKDVEELFGKNFSIIFSSSDALLSLAPAHLMHFILETKNKKSLH